MKIIVTFISVWFLTSNITANSFDTSKGKLEITFIGHGTLMMTLDRKVITHEHGDHLDAKAIDAVK